MNETTHEVSEADLSAFAKRFLDSLTPSSTATVVALTGDLGAGKTTFVKKLAAALGVENEVTSPTFTLMRGYETKDDCFETLLHMDAYRIDNDDELRPLHFEELLQRPNTLFCIEWSERIASALPKDCHRLTFANTNDPNKRSIQIH